jgi:hypothetical protein
MTDRAMWSDLSCFSCLMGEPILFNDFFFVQDESSCVAPPPGY